MAVKFGGKFNLRFDDTNPAREEQEYVDAIIGDCRWLGADWEDRLFFASDYFEQMYGWAEELVKKELAYVCDLSPDEVSASRGTLTEPGRESPGRKRSADENLDLFRRMRKGEFPDGAKTLRARIDMASPNLNLRDPVMYRILHLPHHRQKDKWCIYPMYDWAHGLEDSIEGITHSLCSLEYEDHRPLYDWYLDAVNRGRTGDGSGPWGRLVHHPRQIEFARFNMTHTLMSKRKYLELLSQGKIASLDDPRLPTIAGLRRRGFTPTAIKAFCERIGVAKRISTIDQALLDHYVREELNMTAPRRMAVLRPLKVIITNYPEGKTEEMEAENNPEDPSAGARKVPFGRQLWIERDDFSESPPKGWFRLSPGAEVRLKHAYYIKCIEVVKDDNGSVAELRCVYDPATRGGDSPDGRKVRGTLHWVSADHAVGAEVRLYQPLFADASPTTDSPVNPDSIEVLADCRMEPALAGAGPGDRVQFLRHGYFCLDSRDSSEGRPVFNRTLGLKDSWSKGAK
jgi:glutaminyl-tRNA synthetase